MKERFVIDNAFTKQILIGDVNDINSVFNMVEWDSSYHAKISKPDGTIVFEQANTEFPKDWSDNARNIVASKYFYGYGENRERSLKQFITRIVETITENGRKLGYFLNEDEAINFRNELAYLIMTQRAWFNTPVNFSIGVPGKRQVGSACYILGVEDNLESILENAKTEGLIFKDGSGSGINLSSLRGSNELISDSSGTSSGPMSFDKIYDTVAKITKSGGSCLGPDQLVFTDSGLKTIKDLEESGQDFVIMSYDPSAKRFKAKTARAYKNGRKMVYNLKTDKGEFHLTGDHYVMLADKRYEKVENLSINMSLMQMSSDIPKEGHLRISLHDGNKGKKHFHRLIGEDIIGATKEHVVHHKDGNKLNNSLSNLELLERGAHSTHHMNDLVLGGNHVFQNNVFPKFNNNNGMHKDSDFWKNEEKIASYKQKQSKVLTNSGRARDMQKIASKQKMINIGFKLINLGADISTFDLYYKNRKVLWNGKQGSSRAIASKTIEKYFGNYDNYYNEIRDNNHKVIEITQLRLMDVYDIEVDCESMDDKSPNSGHNFVIFSLNATSPAGKGLVVSNSRRAARMVILNDNHPDIEEFITCKAKEENKAKALIAAGYDSAPGGEAYLSVAYQNANYSVRVSDEFLDAVKNDKDWNLINVKDGKVAKTVKAKELWNLICKSAWESGDPGIQFDSIIQKWHTLPNNGKITASNPCSEFLHLDFSSCNLASINLLKYYDAKTDSFYYTCFTNTVKIFTVAMNILLDFIEFPTEKITEVTKKCRPIGLGFANLGALLMSLGIPYDSDEGRSIAASLMAAITANAYLTSSDLAIRLNRSFEYLDNNLEEMRNVIDLHKKYFFGSLQSISDSDEASDFSCNLFYNLDQQTSKTFEKLSFRNKFLNSQATVLAPTGCLTKNSIISTEHGLVRLRNLGDLSGNQWQDKSFMVMTDEGPKQATKFYINGKDAVRTITTNHGYRITGTNKHKVKIIDKNGNKIWRRFDEISVDDTIIMSMNTIFGDKKQIILPSEPEIYHNANLNFKAPRILDEELAELVGYYMGDGCYCGQEMRLAVAENDLDVIDRLKYLIKNLFNLDAITKPQQGCVSVNAKSYQLMLWWESCGFMKHRKRDAKGKGAFEVHVPDIILASNNEQVYGAFLRGLFEADGCAASDNPSLSSISSQFISDIQTIMLAMGIPTHSRIRSKISSNRYGKNQCYTLSVLNKNYTKAFCEKIDFIGNRKKSAAHILFTAKSCSNDKIPLTEYQFELIEANATQSEKKQYKKYGGINRESCSDFNNESINSLLNNTFYDKVISNIEDGIQDTYDLSVPDNVTYIANGFISHNTIGLAMDCDTTGCEPELALVKYKWLVGGGTQAFSNHCVETALKNLYYKEDAIRAILDYISETGNIENCPFILEEHLCVFDTSFKNRGGTRYLSPEAHIRMLGALAPFISGSASKTVNLPESATIEDISNCYMLAHDLEVKCVAVYRDNCKASQPMSTEIKESKDKAEAKQEKEVTGLVPNKSKTDNLNSVFSYHDTYPNGTNFWNQKLEVKKDKQEDISRYRKRLPNTRNSVTHKFSIGTQEGYLTVGLYEDGSPGEIFIVMSKQGSFAQGAIDALATMMSLALQYGVPVESIVNKLKGTSFDPSGITTNEDIRFASSITDYIGKFLERNFLDRNSVEKHPIENDEQKQEKIGSVNFTPPPSYLYTTAKGEVIDFTGYESNTYDNATSTGQICSNCGSMKVLMNKCFRCLNCGEGGECGG